MSSILVNIIMLVAAKFVFLSIVYECQCIAWNVDDRKFGQSGKERARKIFIEEIGNTQK